MKMESLNQRKLELEKKELQLKESVIKFDKFLKVFAQNIHSSINSKIASSINQHKINRKTTQSCQELSKRPRTNVNCKKQSKKKSKDFKKK